MLFGLKNFHDIVSDSDSALILIENIYLFLRKISNRERKNSHPENNGL
jgi:hypothetical protein